MDHLGPDNSTVRGKKKTTIYYFSKFYFLSSTVLAVNPRESDGFLYLCSVDLEALMRSLNIGSDHEQEHEHDHHEDEHADHDHSCARRRKSSRHEHPEEHGGNKTWDQVHMRTYKCIEE